MDLEKQLLSKASLSLKRFSQSHNNSNNNNDMGRGGKQSFRQQNTVFIMLIYSKVFTQCYLALRNEIQSVPFMQGVWQHCVNVEFHLGQVGKESHILILCNIKNVRFQTCMPENLWHFFSMKQLHLSICFLCTQLANIVVVFIQKRLRAGKWCKEEDKSS